MKKCKICNEDKELTEFRDGRNDCKKCENKKRVERKNRQKVEDETFYEKQREYDKKRKKIMRDNFGEDEKFIESVRGLIKNVFKNNNYSKDSRTFEILGIDRDGFISHIESQFVDGMNWENRGLKGWHVDHIVPVSSAKSIDEMIKLNHYTNLRPLWCDENWKKGSKII
jgi:hypothetical protein